MVERDEPERHVEISALGTRRIVEDGLSNRGIIINGNGSVRIPHNPNFELGRRLWRGEWHKFDNLRDAIRSVIHARNNEFEALQQNRDFYTRLLAIHKELGELGRGSLDADANPGKYDKRKRLLKDYAQLESEMRLKRTQRKARTREHFGVHKDDRGVKRWGGRELLEGNTEAKEGDSRKRPPGGNWPAMQAVIGKQLRLLKAENERVAKKVLPVLRRREGLLRGYHQGHLKRLELARGKLDSALDAIKAALSHERFVPRQIKTDVSSARNAVKKLEYLHSNAVFYYLDNAFGRVENNDYPAASKYLKLARKRLKKTREKLGETTVPTKTRQAT